MLTLWTTNPCNGQDVEKIVDISREADEPPTKPGPAEYTMAMKLIPTKDFVATQIRRENRKSKLSEVAKIEKQRIDRIGEWDAVKKVDFTMLDLGIDRKTIESAARTAIINLTLDFLMK
jgi:hypothetical protein